MSNNPVFGKSSYACPFCHVVAHYKVQVLSHMVGSVVVDSYNNTEPTYDATEFVSSLCPECRQSHIWKKYYSDETLKHIPNIADHAKIIYPRSKFGPEPMEYMPETIKKIFEETREVYEISPRSAFILLRIALELLCDHLGTKKDTLDQKIEELLITKQIDKSMKNISDIIRKIGNKYAHSDIPKEFTDTKTIQFMLEGINHIVNKTIKQPEEIKNMMNKYNMKEQP